MSKTGHVLEKQEQCIFAGDERSVARAANKSRRLGPHALRTAPRDWGSDPRRLQYFGAAVQRFLLADKRS